MVALKLTNEQIEALGSIPGAEAVPVFNSRDNQAYYLVPADVYERLRSGKNEEVSIESFYPLMDDVAHRDGWDDPEMDSYNALDPRRSA